MAGGSLVGEWKQEVSIAIMNPSTVPLFLKTIHIPHAWTLVVSPYVVVVFLL